MFLIKARSIVILAILSILFVIGCDNKNITSQRAVNSPPSIKLDIAVVGDNPYEKIKNINYIQTDLKQISAFEDNTYDGLIITKDYFAEAVEQKHKKFFSNITYPVFFIGTENLLSNVFHDHRLSLETAKIGGFGANVSGFVNINGRIQEWGLFLKDNPTEKDINHDMILRISSIIENFKINNK